MSDLYIGKSFSSGARIMLSELDILNLKRSDYVAFSLAGKSKSRINLGYTSERGVKKDYMFYAFSEIVYRSENTRSIKNTASFVFNPASLNIEWITILSLLEHGDEIEILWCVDWEVTQFLLENNLHYDCVRFVLYKPSHLQYHFRLHTVVGNPQNRLIKTYN